MKKVILYEDGDRALLGLIRFEGPLGIKHVTRAVLEPVLNDARSKNQAFIDARVAKGLAFGRLRDRRVEADEYLLGARDRLIGYLGNQPSIEWLGLGLDGSLQVPRTDALRKSVLPAFQAHFTAHPEREDVARQITAARAGEVYNGLREAIATISDCRRDTRTKRDLRDGADALLEKKLFCLRRELEALLDPLDPRWVAFVGRIPGDPRAPEKVEDVTATAQPGVITVAWPDTARAARYRVLKQVVGADADFVVAETVDESEAELTGVPAGATVKLQIVAFNGVGAGAPSEIIELQAA